MSVLLEHLNSPADIKKLSMPELSNLAEEIRSFLIETISKTGGHLASNLGVIELTLALHYVFDFKTDKLLWDVGHQCYTHKIITGRRDKFEFLRSAEGISGFPNPAESPYDQFAVGHAGTAISTAIGMALGSMLDTRYSITDENRASKIEKREDKIVAMVGDASIVNGTAFEALNNLGLVKRQMLIVLNDNSMAIDATVGAVAKYFSKIRLSQTYEDLRKTTNNILEYMPVIGRSMEEAIERIKRSIRMVLPASQMFESLHIPYFGPVDGHDIGSLVQLFKALAELKHPAILHVYTKKGKGFKPADQGPAKFHSTGPFKMNGGIYEPAGSSDGRKTFTNAFGGHLSSIAKRDKKIVAITSAMCDGTGLGNFREKFPWRFYDVGIAEEAAVDVAAGLAKSGFKPFVCIYSTFLQRCFDQIFQEVSLQNLPVVFCVDRAGFVGADGPTHHGLMDIGFLRMLPNMVLAAPANDIEMKLALEFAAEAGLPMVIRYPKESVPEKKFVKTACNRPFKLGRSITVKQSRNAGLAIVSYGSTLTEALRASEILAQDGIAVTVINARFCAPVDKKIISLLKQGKAIITVEDHGIAGGFGSAVLELAASNGCPLDNVRLLGASKTFFGHDSRDSQLATAGINTDKIVSTAKKMLQQRKTGA